MDIQVNLSMSNVEFDTKKVFKNDIIKVRLIQIHQDHMIASWEESK